MTTPFEKGLFNLLTQQHEKKNLIYSPILLRMCLAMIYVGIEGPARQELAKVLNYTTNTTNKEIIKQFEPLFNKIDYPIATEDEWDYAPDSPDLPKWFIKTVVYVDNNIEVLSSYKKLVDDAFEASVRSTDFSQSSLKAEIDLFRMSMSRPKMNITKSNNFRPSSSSIIIACAAYYNATWLNTFNTGTTKQKTFQSGQGKVSASNIMSQDEKLEYAELPELSSKAINLPFYNSNISMLLILPQRKISLDKLLKLMTNFEVNSITKRLQLRTIKLTLPKFKLDIDLPLLPVLRNLGVKQIFSKGSAHYKHLTNSKMSLYVSDIVLKIFIYVTERGLEMAYYTSIGSGYVPKLNSKTEAGDITRSFVFVLWDPQQTYIVGHANDLTFTY